MTLGRQAAFLGGDECTCRTCTDSRARITVGAPPIWEENQLLRQQLAEANATIARLHESVSVMRRERKHLG